VLQDALDVQKREGGLIMRWWSELKYFVRKLNRRRADRELEEEFRTHLEMAALEKVDDGLSPEEARYAARRAFGSAALAAERSRSMWRFGILEELWRDLRYGARMLLKSPGFALVAVITLALGIGMNTAIFSVVYPVLLRTLPYSKPEKLMAVFSSRPQMNNLRGSVSVPDFIALRAE
jgi:putative ABC transport system permease protein